MNLERSSVELKVAPIGGGPEEACIVTTECVDGSRTIEVVLGSIQLAATSTADFEEALQQLRSQLEAAGLLLQCNRYRRDAFVSGMSRSMSDGLSCYVVGSGEGVDPTHIKPCLGTAPAGIVATAEEADAHIEAWKAKGPTRSWVLRSWVEQRLAQRRDGRGFQR